MRNIVLTTRAHITPSQQEFEIVERKGLGHPDTICDALMEAASVALSTAYLQTCGRVLHFNLDKGLLVAGQSTPTLGGGTIDAPMRIIFGDRATNEYQGKRIPVGEIVEATAVDWFQKNLRFVDPQKHLVMQNEIRPGSPELVDLFARERLTANDTSAAVGYAPLSETEQLVLAAERYLNSVDFKVRHPETGEDVKVMGVRRHRDVQLTVAMAFVDRFVTSAASYFELKAEIQHELAGYLGNQLTSLDRVDVQINTLDDPHRGLGGMYLTVLGTSAEGADGGEVGRGNRVNGLISLNRPMTLEAAAGKNPVSHVGKIYNLLSHQLAHQIQSRVPGVREVYVWLCSQIGRPLDDPLATSVEMDLAPGLHRSDIESTVREIIDEELQNVDRLIERLCRGELPVC
ncbi:MAG: methionine adenosyltransferase [Planctomycetaceae bacterium]|nr:methionine adenosyltransferase [Planctomycetaceae bacterium]